MDRMEEILEIVREIREDVSFMKRHRNMLCGMPILEVDEDGNARLKVFHKR